MSHTPVIETSSDVHLTNLDDGYWRIDVVTHIFADDVEVAQGMISHITKSHVLKERSVPR